MSTMPAAVFHDRPPTKAGSPRLVEQFAAKYGIDPDKMLASLKATAFRQSGGADAQVTNEQMMMLLVVANEYNLNPYTREIYAFASKGGIVPIVSIDGWVRIVNEKPTFKGVAFEYGPPHPDAKFHGAPEWIQCTMIRSDRDVPVAVREYLVECHRNTDPWNTATARMLRHRAYIQCGRIAFGFALHDEDEAQRIIDGEAIRVPEQPKAIAAINTAVKPPINGESTREQDPPAAAATSDKPPSKEGAKQEAAPPPEGSKTEAGVVTFAKLVDRLQKAKDLDVLDADATLIANLPADQQSDATTIYKKRRKEIEEF